jgi:hypothetical protein
MRVTDFRSGQKRNLMQIERLALREVWVSDCGADEERA